jgi:hypothetical protein
MIRSARFRLRMTGREGLKMTLFSVIASPDKSGLAMTKRVARDDN